jgi:hypothetical protein
MPLSDRERALLAQMEEALTADDPRLSSTLTGSATRPKVLIAVGALLAGFVILFVGLISQSAPIGVAGFVIGLVGLVTLLQSFSGPIAVKAPKAKKAKRLGSRLEQRWDRRNNQ